MRHIQSIMMHVLIFKNINDLESTTKHIFRLNLYQAVCVQLNELSKVLQSLKILLMDVDKKNIWLAKQTIDKILKETQALRLITQTLNE